MAVSTGCQIDTVIRLTGFGRRSLGRIGYFQIGFHQERQASTSKLGLAVRINRAIVHHGQIFLIETTRLVKSIAIRVKNLITGRNPVVGSAERKNIAVGNFAPNSRRNTAFPLFDRHGTSRCCIHIAVCRERDIREVSLGCRQSGKCFGCFRSIGELSHLLHGDLGHIGPDNLVRFRQNANLAETRIRRLRIKRFDRETILSRLRIGREECNPFRRLELHRKVGVDLDLYLAFTSGTRYADTAADRFENRDRRCGTFLLNLDHHILGIRSNQRDRRRTGRCRRILRHCDIDTRHDIAIAGPFGRTPITVRHLVRKSSIEIDRHKTRLGLTGELLDQIGLDDLELTGAIGCILTASTERKKHQRKHGLENC